MSRCFPFPPSGYEKKARTENVNFITKEKRKEKKHKKEKRDKEKSEHKEKREKDQSKDKHKEKKDKKEKQKDKKKEDDRDKGRASEDKRAEGETEGFNELHIRGSWQKDEQRKDFKFAEELGRTGDDRETSPMDGSFSSSIQRKNGRMGAAIASQEKERVADIKVFPVQISSAQRRDDGSGLPIENVASSIQQRTVSTGPATALEKERKKMHEKVTVGSGIEQNRNHGVSQPVESISGLFNRKTEGSTAGMEKENFSEKVVSKSIVPGFERGKLGTKIMDSSSLTATQRRKDALCLSMGNLSSIHSKTEDMTNPSIRRVEGMGSVHAIEKDRTRGSEIFPSPVTSEQRRNTKVGKPVEKDRYQKVEKKDKTVVMKAKDRNGHKDRDPSDMWSKVKDKDKHTKEKKKEEKAEVEHIEFREFGKKDQVDTVNSKPLAPQKDNTAGTIGINEMSKKRKDFQANGYLHKEDARPDKIPRMASSFQAMNGRAVELPLAAPTSLSLKSGAMNTMKPDQILENKENKINGTTKSRHLPLEVKPLVAGGLIENCEVSMELPHPDSKYLSQIYTVPEMTGWSEIDDQDWLFNCCDSQQKPKAETESQEAIHVWAQGLQIDSAGVFALPYVVPF